MMALFWDIDGTLLTTNRAGIKAWEGALCLTTGHSRDLTGFRTAGLTDHEIGRALLALAGADGGDLDALIARYEQLLPGRLPERNGRVLPGAREILERAETRTDVCSFLLTGNTAAGAAAKLAHFGLEQYYHRGGGFSESARDRPGIAQAALAHAAAHFSTQVSGIVPVVVGDTPHDIACGLAIGARVVAVATGDYSVASLEANRPWWTLPQLPAPEVFFRRLGLPVSSPGP